jgi:hypothetical protein
MIESLSRRTVLFSAGTLTALSLLACGSGSSGTIGSPMDFPSSTTDGGATSRGHDAGSTDPGRLGNGGAGDASGARPSVCSTDADCNTHDACVAFACENVSSGELHQGQCVYTPVDSGACAAPVPDAGVDAGPPAMMVGLPPIDPACMSSQNLPSTYPPYVPLVPPSVPASCANGFELGDATTGGSTVYNLPSTKPGGAAAITLDVDFATYLEPDGVVITGVDASGATYTLLDTCRIQTWTSGDPTGGLTRPPDETIRQFRIHVTAGTKSLKVDFGGVVSPMYIQVLGLCDFDVSPFSEDVSWSAVP